MVTKQELAANRRRRVIIEGPMGTGKSTALVAFAREIATAGHSVLFMDLGFEEGASEELELIDDTVLARITYLKPKTYAEATSLLKPGRYGLVVVDALQNLRTIAADVAVDILIANDTESAILRRMKSIDGVGNPAVLPYGKGTGMMKDYERKFFERLAELRCDIVCGVNTKSLAASENYIDLIGGMFDMVISLHIAVNDKKNIFTFVIEKVRGVDFSNAREYQFARAENIIVKAENIAGKKVPLRKPVSAEQIEVKLSDAVPIGHGGNVL